MSSRVEAVPGLWQWPVYIYEINIYTVINHAALGTRSTEGLNNAPGVRHSREQSRCKPVDTSQLTHSAFPRRCRCRVKCSGRGLSEDQASCQEGGTGERLFSAQRPLAP